jgi:arylsulfatase A-like enzyme
MFVPPDAQRLDLTRYDDLNSPVKPGLSPRELDYVLSQYDGEIRATDDVLGRLFDRLKSRGLWNDTAVIVTSDHGEEFFEHGQKGHKNNLYIESVHVPLILKRPGPAKPERDSRTASLVDLFPTILELAGFRGVMPPHTGRSLLSPDIAGPVRMELTTSWYNKNNRTGERWLDTQRWLAQRDGSLTVIGMEDAKNHKSQWELYNVAVDPGEHAPITGPADERLTAVKSRLLEWEGRMNETAKLLGRRQEAQLTHPETERLRSMGYLK